MVSESLISKCRRIRLIATDIDGVWTDGTIYYSPNGEYMKAFSTYDGMAVERLQKKGLAVAVFTGEDSPIVDQRITKLNIQNYFSGVKNKLKALTGFCESRSILLSEVAYIGDDYNDFEVLCAVGFSGIPEKSPILTEFVPDYITERPGGKGAFRDFVEIILKLRQ